MEIIKLNESQIPYRFNGESGPKYLMRGPRSEFGMVVLLPGEDFQTHYHTVMEENFFTLEGNVEIYIDGEAYSVAPGDFINVPPKHPHYLINRGTTPWKAVFSKSPAEAKDKIDVAWVPGQPVEAVA